MTTQASPPHLRLSVSCPAGKEAPRTVKPAQNTPQTETARDGDGRGGRTTSNALRTRAGGRPGTPGGKPRDYGGEPR